MKDCAIAVLSSLKESNDARSWRSDDGGLPACLRCNGLIIGRESRRLDVGGEKRDVMAIVILNSFFLGSLGRAGLV